MCVEREEGSDGGDVVGLEEGEFVQNVEVVRDVDIGDQTVDVRGLYQKNQILKVVVYALRRSIHSLYLIILLLLDILGGLTHQRVVFQFTLSLLFASLLLHQSFHHPPGFLQQVLHYHIGYHLPLLLLLLVSIIYDAEIVIFAAETLKSVLSELVRWVVIVIVCIEHATIVANLLCIWQFVVLSPTFPDVYFVFYLVDELEIPFGLNVSVQTDDPLHLVFGLLYFGMLLHSPLLDFILLLLV